MAFSAFPSPLHFHLYKNLVYFAPLSFLYMTENQCNRGDLEKVLFVRVGTRGSLVPNQGGPMQARSGTFADNNVQRIMLDHEKGESPNRPLPPWRSLNPCSRLLGSGRFHLLEEQVFLAQGSVKLESQKRQKTERCKEDCALTQGAQLWNISHSWISKQEKFRGGGFCCMIVLRIH